MIEFVVKSDDDEYLSTNCDCTTKIDGARRYTDESDADLARYAANCTHGASWFVVPVRVTVREVRK